jgi:hypothetical protein
VIGVNRHRALVAGAVIGALVGGFLLTSVPTDTHAPAAEHAPVVRTSAPPTTPLPAAVPAPTSKVRAVTELLRRRAQAVLRRNEAAFMSTVDPKAGRSFLDAQRRLFHNLRGVPLRTWSYPLDAGEAVDVSKLPEGGADELWAPKVDLQYALSGVDAQPTRKQMGYLFARRGGDWYVESDTALHAAGVDAWRGPWDFGPCEVRYTNHGLVLSHPSGAETAQRVAAQLDDAIAAVTSVWGDEWAGRVGVLVPSGAAEMRAMVGDEFAAGSIAAVAIAASSDPHTHTATGQRVVINPEGASELSDLALRVVLRHEITHIAARGYTTDGAPMWLLEGFADYVGYRDSGLAIATAAPDIAAEVRESGAPAGLPSDARFRADSGQLELAYQQSWSMCRYLAEHFSEATLVQLYRRVAMAGHVSASQLDAELRSVTGSSMSELVKGWRQSLRTSFG